MTATRILSKGVSAFNSALGFVANQGRTPGSSTHPAAKDHVHSAIGQDQLLFAGFALNFNITTDQLLIKYGKFTSFLPTLIRVANASGSITTAAGSIYTGAGKTGVLLMTAATVFSGVTAVLQGADVIIAPTGKTAIPILTAASLILALTTPQGAAMTADLYVIGIPLAEP